MLRVKQIFLITTLLSLSLLPLAFSDDFIKNYSYIIITTHTFIVIFYNLKYRTLIAFLTPINILLSYVGISFIIASYAYPNELVYSSRDLREFNDWNFYGYAISYYLMMSTLLFFVDLKLKNRFIGIEYKSGVVITRTKSLEVTFLSILLFLIFSIFPLNLDLFGGSGDVSMIPKTIAALSISYILVVRKISYRFLYYVMILLMFSTFSYGSKREAIFIIFAILMMESVVNNIKPSFRFAFYSLLMTAVLIYLILIMSIMRGYGGYFSVDDSVSFFEASEYVIDYISNDLFWLYLLNNLEVNAVFFHSLNAIDMIMSDPDKLTFGSTIFKVFFIPFPSSVITFKPDSMITLYTVARDPSFRDIGGSWPINIYSEYFWNFHVFGLILFPIFMWCVSILFSKVFLIIKNGVIINHIWMVYAYMEFITLCRGSGLDMYTVYMVVAMLFSLILYSVRNTLVKI